MTMSIFRLPDLGEGLPDAQISQWYVKEGDQVEVDQPLVAMETAKAIVEVPSPENGQIKKCFGAEGDVIKTGSPLVEFRGKDSGTVVGQLKTDDEILEENFIIGSPYQKLSQPNKFDGTPLQGVKRTMAQQMSKSHGQVVPVTIYDDAILANWQKDVDISVKVIKSLIRAIAQQPELNAWFDTKTSSYKQHSAVNLGLAIDTKDGLFVPVLKNAEQLSAKQLRQQINQLKTAVEQRSLPPEAFNGATISLSNFGVFAGRYANPIIVPPSVAIIATGKIRQQVIANNSKVEIHPVMPISLSFDHRLITGGEASRFLAYFIQALSIEDDI